MLRLFGHLVHFSFVIEGGLTQRVGFQFRLRPLVDIGNDKVLQVRAVAKGEHKNRRDEQEDEYAPHPDQDPINDIAAIPATTFYLTSRLPLPDQPSPSMAKILCLIP